MENKSKLEEMTYGEIQNQYGHFLLEYSHPSEALKLKKSTGVNLDPEIAKAYEELNLPKKNKFSPEHEKAIVEYGGYILDYLQGFITEKQLLKKYTTGHPFVGAINCVFLHEEAE